MTRLCILLAFSLTPLCSNALAQSPASATPSPTPAARHAVLDQFGLSNGVFANAEMKALSTDEKSVTKVEYVDQGTFETLNALIEKSEFMEAELSRVLSGNVDISPSSRFRKYFAHNIEGLMHVSEEQRTGRFGGAAIGNSEFARLMQQNEKTIFEILVVLDAGPREYAQFGKELNGVSQKYGVPLLDGAPAGTRLDKPAMLKAMMARLNANYARVKKQIAVRK